MWKKYCKAGQATADAIIHSMRLQCLITEGEYRYRRSVCNTLLLCGQNDHTRTHLIVKLQTIWLTSGGSSTVHIYTQTVHRATELIWEE